MTSPLHTNAAEMARAGSTRVRTDAPTAAAIRDLFRVAHAFFSSELATRERLDAGSHMTGWRRIGIEYSQRADRPDLNETYCYRRHDDDGNLPEHPILHAARRAQDQLDRLAADVLAALGALAGVPAGSTAVKTRNESWLQLNYSHPSTVGRDFIQDAHEDGHLITLLAADAPGLEVLDPADGWTPVLPSADLMVSFAGECGALLSGDLVRPMPHQVRAHDDVPVRLSMAYFVNPDLDQDLPPWVRTARNERVDLLRWGQENPARFGLPVL